MNNHYIGSDYHTGVPARILDCTVMRAAVRTDPFRFRKRDPEFLVVRAVYQFLDGYLCRKTG